MSQEPRKISTELERAFEQAVDLYQTWTPSLVEPTIQFGVETFTISDICRWVAQYSNDAPINVCKQINYYLDCLRDKDLREKLGSDCSYAAAANCLLNLIERRKLSGR